MSYLITAFLATSEVPSASDARAYLLEGALFDHRPEIMIEQAPHESFERMELRYDPERRPIVLRRLTAEDAEASRAEAVDLANLCEEKEIAAAVEASEVVLEWEVDRAELDEDAWFALHLWQAWLLGRSGGWLYAPGDGLFDAKLRRRCRDDGPSRGTPADA